MNASEIFSLLFVSKFIAGLRNAHQTMLLSILLIRPTLLDHRLEKSHQVQVCSVLQQETDDDANDDVDDDDDDDDDV